MSYLRCDGHISPPPDSSYEKCLKSYVSEVQSLRSENLKIKKELNDAKKKSEDRILVLERVNHNLSAQLQDFNDNKKKNQSFNGFNSFNDHKTSFVPQPRLANSDICDALSKKFRSKSDNIRDLQIKVIEIEGNNRSLQMQLRKSKNNEVMLKSEVEDLKRKLADTISLNDAMKIRISNFEDSQPFKTISILEDEIMKLKKTNVSLLKKSRKIQKKYDSMILLNNNNISPPVSQFKYKANSFTKPLSKRSFSTEIDTILDEDDSYDNNNDAFTYTRSFTANQNKRNVSPQNELKKIEDLLKQSYSGYTPSDRLSDQFRDFLDQICTIAANE